MEKKKESRSGNGFMWGVFIGAGLAYLVGTEKGRGLLKELMQEGADFIADISSPEPEENPGVYNTSEEAAVSDSAEEDKESQEGTQSPPKKRFFKAKKSA